MKNLAKLFVVLFVATIGLASCEKEEGTINPEAKKGLVSFNIITPQLSQSQSAPGMCKSSAVKRPEAFPVFIESMRICSRAAAGEAYEEFYFTDKTESEEDAVIQMSPYLGMNKFVAAAFSDLQAVHDQDSDKDGFWTAYCPITTELPISKIIKIGRQISPYVMFSGTANGLVTETASSVNIDMTTLNGRMIASFEMIPSDNMDILKYKGIVEATTTDDVADEIYIGGVHEPLTGAVFGMMYLSNERCIAGKSVNISIKIYEVADVEREHLLKTIQLTEAQLEKFKIIPGKDIYNRVKISTSGAIFISSQAFTFTWDWTPVDTDITIE